MLKTTTTTSILIPSRPEVLIKITEALREDEPDVAQIGQHIKQDVALFSSVIATVNSAYFGLSTEVTSIERAISLLGLSRVFNIVRLAALKNSLSSVGPMERFWDTAAEVAHISALLARHFGEIDTDEAYTLGMLHDCGIPLMMQARPDFKDFLRKANNHCISKIREQEIEKFGIDHYQASAELARKWGIHPTTVEAIKRQPLYLETFAEPSHEHEQMRLSLCLLLLARDISDAYRYFWRIPENKESLLTLRPLLHFLGISEIDYIDLKEDIVQMLVN